MGGKGGKTAAPDYTPIAAANKEAAEIQAATAREQLAWAKETYANDRAVVDQVVAQFLDTSERESAAAAADRERYKVTFQPLEDALVRDAESYASPDRQELEASRAAAEVTANMEGNRRAALASLESYGVDPSQARSAALDAGLRVAQAATVAGASNQARLNAENTGRALRGEAINIGRGYPGQIAQAYGTAQGAGAGAVGSALQATQTGAQTMGTGLGWTQASNGVLGQWGNQVTSQIGSANAANAQRAASNNAMIGQLVGAVGGTLLSPSKGFSNTLLGSFLSS